MRTLALLTLLVATSTFAETPDTHPVLSTNGSWVPIMLIVVGGLFLAAAVIGPIVRANAPEEVPPAHSHDEPPGTSHHHGASGTVNPAPEDDLPSHHH